MSAQGLPEEIWGIILSLVTMNSLLEMRRVNKYLGSIVKGLIMRRRGTYKTEIEEWKGKLPNAIEGHITRSELWGNFVTGEGKVVFLWKCLKWTYEGPQGPYKPYWHFIKTRLPTFSDLEKLHGINREDYENYLREQWGKITAGEKECIKYEGRLKNVLECIEGKDNKGALSGRRAKIRRCLGTIKGKREITIG